MASKRLFGSLLMAFTVHELSPIYVAESSKLLPYMRFSSCAFVSLVVKFSDTAVPRRCSPHGQASVKYVLMRRVYFDNNASTLVLPEAFEAMRPYFAEHFGNAASIHHHAHEMLAALEP